jgi:hypothetical protein
VQGFADHRCGPFLLKRCGCILQARLRSGRTARSRRATRR